VINRRLGDLPLFFVAFDEKSSVYGRSPVATLSVALNGKRPFNVSLAGANWNNAKGCPSRALSWLSDTVQGEVQRVERDETTTSEDSHAFEPLHWQLR
jgi:hypothetical protein